MTVGEQVQAALDYWSVEDGRSALWHATNAVDETAAKRYPGEDPESRFKRTVRDDVDIFGALTAADLDFTASRFPVRVASELPDGRPDIADLLCAVHRYLHEDEGVLSAGCEITPHAAGVPMFEIISGRLALRASAALGLLGIATFAEENKDESIPENYHLGWQQYVFHVNAWWGWQNHFRAILARAAVPQVPLDFAEEWDSWTPV